MPKVIFNIPPGMQLDEASLNTAGKEIQRLAAAACSTDEVTLDPNNDVDWVVYHMSPGSRGGIGIELITIGYPNRVQRLTEHDMLIVKNLKTAIIDELNRHMPQLNINPANPFLWVQFVQGPHV